MIPAYREKLLKEEKLLEENLINDALEFLEEGVRYRGITAKRIVFCEGYGMVENPFFRALPMVGSKGELLNF